MQLQHCGEHSSANTSTLFFLFCFRFERVFLLPSHFTQERLTRSAEKKHAGNHSSPPGYKITITIKIKYNKINPGMDVANQLLKPEVVLDWATTGKRLPATEHAKQLHIRLAFLQHPCPTFPFTKHERQIIGLWGVCFHWGFLLLVKLQPTALRGSLQCYGWSKAFPACVSTRAH